MAQLLVEVPDEVFTTPLDGPLLPAGACDGAGMPVGAVLRWIDTAPFGGWSVSLLTAIDPAEVDEADLPRLVRLLDQAEAALAARKSAAVAQLARRPAAGAGFRQVDAAAHELVVALRVPLGAAQTEVYRARRLATHLPGTRAAYADGLLTSRHVAKMIAGTGRLTPEQCAQVEATVLDGAEALSVHEFARRVRRAVARCDPAGLAERHRAAAAHADVSLQPDDDAMGWLTGWMPLLDALIVKKAVDAYAMARTNAGDPRPVGVLRADGLRMMAEAYLTGQLTGQPPTTHGRPVEIQVCATPDALAGLTDTPGEIPGVGPVPIEVIREMARDAHLRWLTIAGDTGRLLDRNPTRRRLPADLHAHADATYVTSVGPHSTIPAERCDGEHQQRFPDGQTIIANTAPMDRGWHRAKTFAGFHAHHHPDGRIEWTTPLGQTITIEPYDYRLGP